MALVNNKSNFIFFHLYKCGGNSLRRILNAQTQGGQELLGVHVLPKEAKKHFTARGKIDRFNEMFKFTIVRNPFDFVLSTYHYVQKFPHHFMYKDVINMEFSAFPDYYVKWIAKHRAENIHGKNKVTTIYDFLHDYDGKPIMDYIAKLENIDEDAKEIFKEIGIKGAPIPRVNVNKANNKKYQDVYNAETREKVERYFARDLKLLDYKF